MKTITLKSGGRMPALGQGTWTMTEGAAERAVSFALEIGFRHIDTADRYGNHREVGQAIKSSGLKREDVFLTTKVWREDLAPEALERSAERFLEELDTGYIDLLLIHWPNRKIPIAGTMEALQKVKERGIARAVGVSNFTVRHLEEALKTGITIDANQVEFHPSLNQKELKAFCDKNGIVVEAYSPLAQRRDFDLPVIRELAEKYRRTPAQIILNWLTAKGLVAIHGSRSEAHIRENLASQDFTLAGNDVERMEAASGESGRISNPDFAEFDPE